MVAARRSLKEETAEAESQTKHPFWAFLDLFTQRQWAQRALLASALLVVILLVRRLRQGD